MNSASSIIIRQKTEELVEVSRFCPEKVYVELRVPKETHSVSKVIFRTISHDQGFSNNAEFRGTYLAWFVAAVVTPGGHDRVPRRAVQYNVHASVEFREHEVYWEADSSDASIRRLLKEIRGGDAIRIIPKAQFQAWINFVQEAEIEVHYDEDVADSEVDLTMKTLKAAALMGGSCYRDLDQKSHEIRLVLLNSGVGDDPISCSLIYTSLDVFPLPVYEALSYCWGDPRERREILISASEPEPLSDYCLQITTSLHTAMKNIRPKSGPPRLVWIDSICINQQNLDERSAQVALMAGIYRSANRVVIWLGEENKTTKKSIQIIKIVNDRYERYRQSEQPTAESIALLHDSLMKDGGVDEFVDSWSLFEAPWFRRTWVVQEIFNSGAAVVCCGQDTLTWPMIMRVGKCIGLSDMKANSAYKAFMPPIFEYLVGVRMTTETSSPTETEILEILVKGLDLDATDPRDKIFAMMQFGKETRDLNLLPADLVPDYRTATSEVFAKFTKWWIVVHRSLRILSAIQALQGRTWQQNYREAAPKLESGQPSWSWWHRGQSNWAIGILGLEINCLYRATAETEPDVEMILNCQESNTLPLTGIRLGTIKEVAPYPYYRPPPGLEQLHRTYVGIFDPLNYTGKWTHQLGSKNIKTYITSDDPVLISGHFYAHHDFSSKTAAIECHSRCFFHSVEGLLGLCPFAAQSGDLITILHGGRVPYVLRECRQVDDGKEGRRYEFVGECFLEGYMDGAGYDKQRENAIPAEVFHLV